MSPPNDESHLYEQFQLWLHRPDAVPRREGADTAPAEALIEDAMWAAYRAGYRQAASGDSHPSQENEMKEQDSLEATNRRIAADMLIALIEQKCIKPGGVSANQGYVIDETLKAYQALLTGIDSAKYE